MQEFQVGDKVRVHTGNTGVREGEIIFRNDSFFTVDFKNYPESFQHFELKTGSVRMEVLR